VASVAELLAGSPERHLVTCDYGPLVSSLIEKAGRDCGIPLLRTYWYDASITGQPEHDQVALADLPGVRLRLGRLVRGEQKGVDSRIVRDLIVLARDHAISAAHLLAGDEDICEGVAEAQDHGVRVTLMSVPGVNQSRLLVQQSDGHHPLSDEFWRAHFRLHDAVRDQPMVVGGTAVTQTAETPVAATVALEPVSPGRYNRAMVDALSKGLRTSEDVGSYGSWMRQTDEEKATWETMAKEAGAEYAREWRQDATPPEVEKIRKLTGWQVPREIDPHLLRFAETRLGYLWERPELKPIVRNGFWEEIRQGA
jgi:uncharacterized LabA/DUF88 family protein